MRHYLAGLQNEAALETWDRRGASFEGLVIEELISRAQIDDPGARAYFWGTHGGGETDLLLVSRGVMTPIEIKRSSSVDARELNPLRRCMADLGLKRGVVIYRGRKRVRLTADVDAIPWDEIRAGGASEQTPGPKQQDGAKRRDSEASVQAMSRHFAL